MKIKMTSILVPDPIKAFKYYTEVLGFQELMYMPEHKLAIVVSPEDPNGTSLLLEPQGDGFAKEYKEIIREKKLPYLVLDAPDVQAKYEEFLTKGVEFLAPPKTDDWGTAAIFDDQQGNYLQIHQDK